MTYNQDTRLAHHGIIGMKWGVRRYQNKDGTLTTLGKKRYDRDVQTNLAKKKENRIDTSKPDPSRWVKEDLERRKRLVDLSSDMVKRAKNFEQDSRPKATRQKLDLSKMTDQELRDRINREQLEQQYQKLFSKETAPKISKGRKFVQAALETSGAILTTTSSALAIALAVKELRGK